MLLTARGWNDPCERICSRKDWIGAKPAPVRFVGSENAVTLNATFQRNVSSARSCPSDIH